MYMYTRFLNVIYTSIFTCDERNELFLIKRAHRSLLLPLFKCYELVLSN